MSFDNYNYKMPKAQIEEKARGYGMKYPDECKVIFKSDKDKK